MIDGRHTGTGGGNHVVLGGATAADSPFLRRPDLLKSLVLYWQRRPSLSYLFSGLFIGPTSQAPRVDEARQDMLYELEIALAKVPAPGGGDNAAAVAGRSAVPQSPGRRHRQHPPHRNLHRQAVLAGRPDRPARPGRIPLVRDAARRAHEPGAAIAAARAGRLVLARAARRRAGALGHGAARPLHARAFRLAGFPRRARRSRARRLSRSIRSGSRRSANSAFRIYGAVQHGGVQLELRHALEPWYVLGEEGVAGGTVRFVDSSVERLQVKVEGLNASRHVVTCNGRRVPLTSTGRSGEYVAGVRFKAWELAVGAASDHRRRRRRSPSTSSTAGAGARSAAASITSRIRAAATTRPSRSIPTRREARRRARFEEHRPHAGPIDVPPAERSLEYPTTLDLRRPI